jgi:hypothetical protein
MKFILPLSLILLSSCVHTYNQKDYVFTKCVVDSISIKEPHSTIEIGVTYCYHTNCGEKILSKYKTYTIGDTITFVYRK